MSDLPNRLKDDEYLIKIHGTEADCNHPGKQPVGSATEGPFYHGSDPELLEWIDDGGNVGKALVGPFVVVDVDQDAFADVLEDHLPPTFVVRTGSGGEHRYYHCPEWTDNRQVNVDGTDYGSVRSEGWQVVIPPSVHPETGEPYRVLHDRHITSVGPETIRTALEDTGTTDSQHSGGGGGCAGSSSSGLPAVPGEYPGREAGWNQARSWLEANDLLGELRLSSGDRSAREFLLAKCLAEGGFSEAVISDALDRLPFDSKWHERGESYRTRTVRNAVVAACDDDHVDFSQTAYKSDGSSSDERRKTESGGGNAGYQNRGDNDMPDFTDIEEAPILEADEPGDDFKKVVRVEGVDDDGETFHYVALKEGFKREGETDDGQTVTFEQTTDSTSLGSPQYLEDLIEGLEALNEKLDN